MTQRFDKISEQHKRIGLRPKLEPCQKGAQNPTKIKNTKSSSDKMERLNSFSCIRIPEPELVSICPYHRGKILPLDKYKYSFLEKFLSRTTNQGKDLCFFLRQVMTLEWRIRRCYSEDLSMASSEFVQMMLLDASFIIEVLRHFGRSEEFTDGFSFFLIEPWRFPILV